MRKSTTLRCVRFGLIYFLEEQGKKFRHEFIFEIKSVNVTEQQKLSKKINDSMKYDSQ